MGNYTKTLDDYLELVKRRKIYILAIWLLVSVTALVIAGRLPKIYRSTATLLIEAPIPTNLIETTVTASQYADEQMQGIYQRVMSADNVAAIINEDRLYLDSRKDDPHELTELFRSRANVRPAPTSLTPQYFSGMAAIAFNLSFSDNNPVKAQHIAAKLAAMFIDQNDKARAQRATKVSAFLMEESDKLNHELQRIDTQIAQYKEEHSFSLPEQMQGNLAAIDRAENELRDTESQIRSTREKTGFLMTELARTRQELPVDGDARSPLGKSGGLAALRAQYLHYSSIYSPDHPSLVRLKREIKALDGNFGGQADSEDLLRQLAEARQTLRLLEENYSPGHPDIARRKKQIAHLEQQLHDSPSPLEQVSMADANPLYLNVEMQYKSAQSELQALMAKQNYLKTKLDKMQDIVLQAPQVELGYTDLIRERDNAIKKYTQLKEKWLDARLVQTLEEHQQGQTLTLIEEPSLPVRPEKAIRQKVALGGIFAGLLAGLGTALLIEFMEPGVRGYRAICAITGLMPLVVIPYLTSSAEHQQLLAKQRRKRQITAALIVLTVIAVIFYCLPLAQNLLESKP